MLGKLQGRRSFALLITALSTSLFTPAVAKEKSPLERRRKRAEKRSGKRDSGKSRTRDKGKKKLLPSGGTPQVLFKDENDAPNGPGGFHPTVDPFTAEVGNRIRIVARNEVVGEGELDAIWLHCMEGKGGSVKLLDAMTPNECKKDANTVGVFLDTTIRIRNT